MKIEREILRLRLRAISVGAKVDDRALLSFTKDRGIRRQLRSHIARNKMHVRRRDEHNNLS